MLAPEILMPTHLPIPRAHADFIPPNQPEPPAPSDPRVRELLVAVAGIAARSWSAEVDAAQGWPPEPEPPFARTVQPVFTAPTPKGGRK